jgi:tRNA-specific 2-thiouridylase
MKPKMISNHNINNDENIEIKNQNFVDFSGDIIDTKGKKLGVHAGIQNFTIGQRRGIGIQSEEPLYVVKIDSETKQVIVGNKQDLRKNVVKFNELTWVNPSKMHDKMKVSVRVRSMQKSIDAVLFLNNIDQSNDKNEDFCIVKLSEPQYFVAPGQACVVYNGEELLGGGTIVEGYFEDCFEDVEV